MKIVLLTPPSKLFSSGRENISEPLGLLYLASMIRDHQDVYVIDGFSEGLETAEIVEKTIEFDPDIVGISTVFSVMINSGLEIAREIKNINPDILIAFGGNHATFTAKSLIEESAVDIIFCGESEFSFREWIIRVESRESLEGISGTILKINNQIKIYPPQESNKNLDMLPFPARDLYLSPTKEKNRIGMITSRGCPFGCIYCSTCSFWGKKWRARSANNIFLEINQVIENHADQAPLPISFGDDLFTQDSERVKELCNLILREKLRIFWGCSARIETVNPTLIELMGKAGCTGIFFGLESGSERVLQRMKRYYAISQVKETFKICLDNGILPTASFMIGIAYETREDVEKTIELIDSLPTSKIQVHIFTIYPGTPVYKFPAKYGVSIINADPEFVDMNRKCAHRTSHLNENEIEELYKLAFGKCQRRSWEDCSYEEVVKKKSKCEWIKFMGDSKTS